jgi:hypothetical protein
MRRVRLLAAVAAAGLLWLTGPAAPATPGGQPAWAAKKTTTTRATTTTTTTLPATTTTGAMPTTTVTMGLAPKMSAYANPQAAVDAQPSGGILEVDQLYTLTGFLLVNKPLTLFAPDQTKGFRATSGAFSLIVIQASDVQITGLGFDGNYPTAQNIGAVDLDGSLSGVRLVGLKLTNLAGGVGLGNGAMSDIWFTDSTGTNSKGSFFASYDPGAGNAHTNVHVERNTLSQSQQAGAAGNAAIQTAGMATNRHHHWTVADNTVNNPDANPSDQVGIGLDQIADSQISGNTVTNSGDPTGGEGIVVNGPGNTISGNNVSGVNAGSITLISYGNAAQGIVNVTVDDNDVQGDGNGQGVALSFPASATPMSGVVITNNRLHGAGFGIQAYSNGGTVSGSVQVSNNDLTGNVSGGCALGGLNVSGSGNTPACP